MHSSTLGSQGDTRIPRYRWSSIRFPEQLLATGLWRNAGGGCLEVEDERQGWDGCHGGPRADKVRLLADAQRHSHSRIRHVRLEQAMATMVEKVIARQRLGQCKAAVRNQATMESRDGA